MRHNDSHNESGCGRGLYADVDQSPLRGRGQHFPTLRVKDDKTLCEQCDQQPIHAFAEWAQTKPTANSRDDSSYQTSAYSHIAQDNAYVVNF